MELPLPPPLPPSLAAGASDAAGDASMQPWTCENCGNEHDTPALITLLRCALCEEKRYLLPQRSATQETKSSQQSYASDDDDDDDAYSFADSAADRDDGIEEDVKLAEQEFGPGAVIFTRLAGASAPQTLDLHLEPPKLLPCDVCTAWGLPARLQLRLAFENGAAYRCQRVDRLTLWHAGRGEKGEAVDAAADGCLVAQQLLRIVTTFWDALAAGQPLGVELPLSVGGEGGGGGEGGAIECDGGDDGAKLLAPTGKRLRRQDAGGSSSSDGSDGSGTAELLLPGMPRRQDSRATSQQAAHAHALPATATLSYVRDRLRSLNAYCAICDEPHPFGAMLQPTVSRWLPIASDGFRWRPMASIRRDAAAGAVRTLPVPSSASSLSAVLNTCVRRCASARSARTSFPSSARRSWAPRRWRLTRRCSTCSSPPPRSRRPPHAPNSSCRPSPQVGASEASGAF